MSLARLRNSGLTPFFDPFLFLTPFCVVLKEERQVGFAVSAVVQSPEFERCLPTIRRGDLIDLRSKRSPLIGIEAR